MKCLNCNKYLTEEITYQNIFKKSYEQICKSCFYKFDHINRHEVIPAEQTQINMITLFRGKHLKNPQSLANYLVPYYLYWIQNNLNDILIISDSFDEEIINILTKLNLGTIFYVVIFEKTTNNLLF